jgi:hypothetical protein
MIPPGNIPVSLETASEGPVSGWSDLQTFLLETLMIELLFVVCLKTLPDTCQEHSLLSLEGAGVMSCLMQAQPQLAEWSQSHPSHEIKRWSCRNASDREIRA